MARPIRLNAFAMNSVVHQSPGLWTHPRDRSVDYTRLEHWTELARLLERGLFDGVFLADVLGTYDVYGGSNDAAVRRAVQVPVNDPLLLIPAMAAVTEHLGFGVTATLSYEPPYTFARRMSTLDHLTGGRIGWNVVTGYLASAARAAGERTQRGHDDRYDVADEYLDVVYALWEGSWEDGAVVRDRARGVYADPARVHRVEHRGANYTVDAVHLSEPSPQRTPVIYQAGSSERGRAFAARHAECVFVSGQSPAIVAPRIADIRARAEALGRDPRAILFYALATIVPGRTQEEAEATLADYRAHVSLEGAAALVSGWTGVDLSRYALDEQLRHETNDAVHSLLASFTTGDPDRAWTIRDVIEWVGIGGHGPVFHGTPGAVVDQLEAWVAATDVDGFNLAFTITPGTFEDVVELVVPELQARGLHRTAYQDGTLREKLGGTARLPATHPAAAFRRD
ncbi:MAG: LLM class flavin-dependent oxidoreductase [Thermoleophilia bacterium]